MDAFFKGAGPLGGRRWSHGIALAAVVWGAGALAQVVSVPAAHLNHAEGTVAWSPKGDSEWPDVQPRRLLKRGDRLWTDSGSRAELQAGGHALRLDGQTQVVLANVSDTATQLSVTQGSAVATVTRVNPGDSFEVGTPNLAFRARQPGDYRIDVDGKGGTTRVVVISGSGVVFGERGEALELRSGQRATFRERSLARVPQATFVPTDDFDRWAGARRRGEPTVRMPAVAQAAPQAPAAPPSNGRTIIIAGPASGLPGAKQQAPAKPQAEPAVPAAAPVAPLARAQSLPSMNMPTGSTVPAAAAPLRVAIPQAPSAQPAGPLRQEEDGRAAQRAEDGQRGVAGKRAPEEQHRALATGATMRAEDERRQAQVRRADETRKQAVARREQEQRRAVTAKRAEEERRQAAARRSAEEKKLALARKEDEKRVAQLKRAEAQKLADARRRQLARLQEQAGRDEQSVRQAQAWREQQARRVDDERREELVRREDQARRDEQARREDEARREAADRRQRQLAEQWRRDFERREQEVWLRQQQPLQPVRPPPMGVPGRRVS